VRAEWKPAALRALRKLDRRDRERVLTAVERLEREGLGDVVRLAGTTPPEYRLRVGDFRVRFGRDVEASTIVILHVAHRREAYR